MHRTAGIALALVCAAAGCSRGERAPETPPLRFWHTFNPVETEALNRFLADSEHRARATLLPFSRAQHIVRGALIAGAECPDLVRIDATWLPALVAADRLAPVPEARVPRGLLPEAAELATAGGVLYGLPQALDGLVLLARRGAEPAPWPPPSWEAVAVSVREAEPAGLGLRVDGYWFVPFLRAAGGSLPDPASGRVGADEPAAERALAGFASLFGAGGVAPDVSGDRDQAREIQRRFVAGELAAVIEGPWAVSALSGGEPERLSAAPLPPGPGGQPTAPRGGAVLVVPRCAERAEAAWALAAALIDPALQSEWAARYGLVPTTAAGLARSGRLAEELYRALEAARPLPAHPASAELFDDLTPAVEAVVAGDARADEALAGVTRAWTRLLRRHGAAVEAP